MSTEPNTPISNLRTCATSHDWSCTDEEFDRWLTAHNAERNPMEPWMAEWLTAYADRDDIATIDMIVIDRTAQAIKGVTND